MSVKWRHQPAYKSRTWEAELEKKGGERELLDRHYVLYPSQTVHMSVLGFGDDQPPEYADKWTFKARTVLNDCQWEVHSTGMYLGRAEAQAACETAVEMLLRLKEA